MSPRTAATTIIDGDTESRATVQITGGQTTRTRIEGFTVTGGRTGSFAPVDNPLFLAGGGAYVESSSPFFDGCVFTGNRSTFGGNFYGVGFDGEIRDCDFADGFASPAETARESGYELASIVAASIPNSLSVTRSLSCPLSYRPSSYSDSDRRDAPAGRRTQSSSYAILGARRPPRRRGV